MSLGLVNYCGLEDSNSSFGFSTKSLSCYFPNGLWCAGATLPISFSVVLILVCLMFSRDKAARKQTANAIFHASKELVGVFL